MTENQIGQYFKYHNENKKLLKIGFDNIRYQIKTIYKSKNKHGIYIYSLNDTEDEKIRIRKIEKALFRVLSGIQVSWAEECFKRLLYEKGLFTDLQREYLLKLPALDQKWYNLLKIAFLISYDLVPESDETCKNLKLENKKNIIDNEDLVYYLELKKIIKFNLAPNFTIRNKVQHGEWEYAFKTKNSIEFCQVITDQINKENIVTTNARFNLVDNLYQMIINLGRFKSKCFAIDSTTTPFKYYYSGHIKKINFELSKIKSLNLEDFISEIVLRDIRGQKYRQIIGKLI